MRSWTSRAASLALMLVLSGTPAVLVACATACPPGMGTAHLATATADVAPAATTDAPGMRAGAAVAVGGHGHHQNPGAAMTMPDEGTGPRHGRRAFEVSAVPSHGCCPEVPSWTAVPAAGGSALVRLWLPAVTVAPAIIAAHPHRISRAVTLRAHASSPPRPYRPLALRI